MIENQYGFRGGIGTDDMRFEDLELDASMELPTR
jgi:hypothetical protein